MHSITALEEDQGRARNPATFCQQVVDGAAVSNKLLFTGKMHANVSQIFEIHPTRSRPYSSDH
ncbi:MAG: hypothetical protein R2788_01950 [Saprospiraceae bacterium]